MLNFLNGINIENFLNFTMFVTKISYQIFTFPTGSFLSRWKKNWFVLYASGHLAYFETDSKKTPERSLMMCVCCQGVKTGGDVSVFLFYTTANVI